MLPNYDKDQTPMNTAKRHKRPINEQTHKLLRAGNYYLILLRALHKRN